MEYLETNFKGDDCNMGRDLIQRGLKVGRDESIKILKRYLFQLPIVLLVVCSHPRGPAFLRSVLSVLDNNAGTVAPVVLIHNDHVKLKWGRFKYIIPGDRLTEEQEWYNLLMQSETTINDLIFGGAKSASTR